jgi:hypothetical protein
MARIINMVPYAAITSIFILSSLFENPDYSLPTIDELVKSKILDGYVENFIFEERKFTGMRRS